MNAKRRNTPKFTLGHLLKYTRVTVSIILFCAMLLMFVTVEGIIARWFGWIPKIQFFPVVLAGCGAAVAIWLGITLLFGRVYCSSVCPMGILQDIFNRLSRLTRARRRRHPFRYRQPSNRTRYAFLFVMAVAAILGIAAVTSLLDPYSAFGRIGSEMLQPVAAWISGNQVIVFSWVAFAIAAATLLAVGWVASRHGRLICNTVCPVGATLGLFSRWSLFHLDIDTDLCINCRKCERVCKAQCIDTQAHVVDGSRCVNCFNCLIACDSQALRYTTRRKRLSIPMLQKVSGTAAPSPIIKPEAPAEKRDSASAPAGSSEPDSAPVRVDRRQFLATGLIVAAAPALTAAKKGANRIQALQYGGKPLTPTRYVAPPGRRSMADFLEKCTGCGLCVARCPAKVLRPSYNEFGWLHMLHPVMHFDSSYCRYNCTRCTDVCPTGAILPLTVDEKHIFIIGHARVETDNCIGCGLCAERCPREAVKLVARPGWRNGQSIMVASVNTDLCIGCGACEYICPATPLKAIVVDGIS